MKLILMCLLSVASFSVVSSPGDLSTQNNPEIAQNLPTNYSLLETRKSNCASPEDTAKRCLAYETASNFLSSSVNLTNSLPNSEDCGKCIRKWCDYECDGFGDKCTKCIKRWCDWEC